MLHKWVKVQAIIEGKLLNKNNQICPNAIVQVYNNCFGDIQRISVVGHFEVEENSEAEWNSVEILMYFWMLYFTTRSQMLDGEMHL